MAARKTKKQQKLGSYHDTLSQMENVIGETAKLIVDAQKNGDKIAAWGLTFIYDDLIKSYHRLGNLRNTIKGNRE